MSAVAELVFVQETIGIGERSHAVACHLNRAHSGSQRFSFTQVGGDNAL
jgi:hypothetical protein